MTSRDRITLIGLWALPALCGAGLYLSPALHSAPAAAEQALAEDSAPGELSDVADRGVVRDHRGMVPSPSVSPPPIKPSPVPSVVPSLLVPTTPVYQTDVVGWKQLMSTPQRSGTRWVPEQYFPRGVLAWRQSYAVNLFDQAPVVSPNADKTIYIGTMDTTQALGLIAVNPANGSIKWQTGLHGLENGKPYTYIQRGTPVIKGDGSLIVPAYRNEKIYKRDGSFDRWSGKSRLFHISPTGRILASSDPSRGGGWTSSPLHVSDNEVYWGGPGHLFRFNGNLSLMEEVTRPTAYFEGSLSLCAIFVCFDTSGIPVSPDQNVEPIPILRPSPALIDSRILIMGDGAYRAYTFKTLNSTASNWQDKRISSPLTPAVISGRFATIEKDDVGRWRLVLRGPDSTRKWTSDLMWTSTWRPSGLAGFRFDGKDYLFITGTGGFLYAIQDGKTIWTKKIAAACLSPNTPCPSDSAPSIVDTGSGYGKKLIIVASSEGKLYAFDRQGSQEWVVALGGLPTTGAPAIVNGRVYVALRDGLAAVD